MIPIKQAQIIISLPREENFLPYINQSLSFPQNKINIPKYKFITRKRGRKNKIINILNKRDIYTKGKKVHGKFSNDNIKRRLKGLFNNYIIHLLNSLLKKRFKNNKIKFIKMNVTLTQNITIDFNRNLLEKRIKDIIINVSDKYSKNKDNNKNCIQFIQSQKDVDDIINILNMTYKELYINYYLKSKASNNSYEAHKEKILEVYGKEYLDKFVENAEGFVDFFCNGKNRKSKKQKEIEAVNTFLENEKSDTISTSDLSMDNYFVKKNMVSSYAQTEIEDINVKLIAFG